jgi:hypothetical protein
MRAYTERGHTLPDWCLLFTKDGIAFLERHDETLPYLSDMLPNETLTDPSLLSNQERICMGRESGKQVRFPLILVVEER